MPSRRPVSGFLTNTAPPDQIKRVDDKIRSGTQSIEKAVRILRELATRGSLGFRLVDLAEQCEIDRATTHRILGSMARMRLVEQRCTDRRYTPGPLLFELAASMSPFTRFQELCRTTVEGVSRQFRAVATVSLRSDNDFVCIARAGPTVRAMTVEAGTRRPMLTSVSGVAILIALPEEKRKLVISENLLRLGRFDESRHRALLEMVSRSKKRGFAVSEGLVVTGITAVGVPVLDHAQEPFASLALVGPSEKLPGALLEGYVRELRKEAAALEGAVLKLDDERVRRQIPEKSRLAPEPVGNRSGKRANTFGA